MPLGSPFYIAVIFLFNVYLGFFSLACVILMVILALVNRQVSRKPMAEANTMAIVSNNLTSNNLANAEVIESMGCFQAFRALV